MNKLVGPERWLHYTGEDSPANITTRNASVAKLAEGLAWCRGPTWLAGDKVSIPMVQEWLETAEIPCDCSNGLKISTTSKITALSTSGKIIHRNNRH